MTEPLLIAAICGAVASLLVAIRSGERELEVISKAAASAGFVALGLLRWSAGDPVATWLVVGLGLCAAGDLFLLGKRFFDVGLVVFLLGHVAYIVAFQNAEPMIRWPMILLAPVVLASAGATVWLWPHLGARRPSVIAYVVAISIMVWGGLAVGRAGSPGWTVAAGAVLFYLSDLAVARHRFVSEAFINRGLGLPLYYAGQVLIAMSVT